MSRLIPVALLLAGTCAVSACTSDAAAPPERERERAEVVRAADPSGDVELTTYAVQTFAPDEPKYAQVDLTRVELQRRSSGLRIVYRLAGPVGVDGYRTELILSAYTGVKKGRYRSLDVYAYLWPDGPFASAGGAGTPDQNCDSDVRVTGRTVRVDVPGRCLPKAFRGRVVASAGLYTDSEDSESRLAGDTVTFKGRPGLPAAP